MLRDRTARGFTLIEILIVIGLIAILASVVLVAINPLRQFAQARNAQRSQNVSELLNAVGERIVDNRGIFEDDEGACSAQLPTAPTNMRKGGGYDIRPCLSPVYISDLPFDPATGSNTCEDTACSGGDYDTGYTIAQDPSSLRITICAPGAKEPSIPDSAPICVTR